MTPKRDIKTVSFSANDYEQRLLEHATNPTHGNFSQYVKRLIDRDLEGLTVSIVPKSTTVKEAVVLPTVSDEDREEARRLLF